MTCKLRRCLLANIWHHGIFQEVVSKHNSDAGRHFTNDLKLSDGYVCSASAHMHVGNGIHLGVRHDCKVGILHWAPNARQPRSLYIAKTTVRHDLV